MILATHGIVGSQIAQFVGLLDLYPSAAAAYSLRKLRTAYTGSAIRVRRTNLDEADIGFTSSGELDTTALLAFTGTGALDNGFVKTWYDQSGNARNATQTTALNQPQIVSAGSVILENGKPTVQFDGINDQFSLNTVVNNPNYLSIIGVFKNNSATTAGVIFSYRDDVTELIQLTANNSTEDRLQIRSSVTAIQQLSVTTTLKQKLGFAQFNNVTPLHSLYIDSINNITNSTSFIGNLNSNTNYIGGTYAGLNILSGIVQELILYPSDQSSNRTGIETNINDFYSIY
jgi:hypothetical protein